MDMVITDWDGAFCERWLAKHPEDEQIIRGRTKFEIERNFPLEKRDEVLKVIAEPGPRSPPFFAAPWPDAPALPQRRSPLEAWRDQTVPTSET
eukprot:216530-Rhodomonas_salina.1